MFEYFQFQIVGPFAFENWVLINYISGIDP